MHDVEIEMWWFHTCHIGSSPIVDYINGPYLEFILAHSVGSHLEPSVLWCILCHHGLGSSTMCFGMQETVHDNVTTALTCWFFISVTQICLH